MSALRSLRSVRWGDAAVTWTGAILGIVVLVAFTVPRIDRYGFTLDEAFSQGAINQLELAVRSTGGTMAGYYALLKVWAAIGGESVWWLRSLSLVLSVGTLAVLAALARRLGGRRVALVAPTLCALTYMFALKAYEARGYALETLLATVAWYSLVRLVEAGPELPRVARRWSVVLAVALVCGPLAHGLFTLVTVSVVLAALLAPERRWTAARVLPGAAVSAVVVGVLFFKGAEAVGDWVAPTRARTVGYAVLHLTSPNRLVAALLLGLFSVACAVAVRRRLATRAGGGAEGRPDRMAAWKATLAPLWVLVPFVGLLAMSVVRPEFVDRYLTPVTPGVALGVAAGAVAVHDAVAAHSGRRTGQGTRPALVAVPAVVAVVALLAVQSVVVQGNREDWRRAALVVAALNQPGDGIILTDDLSRPPFESAWADVPHGNVPTVIDSPRPLGTVLRIDRWKNPRAILRDLDRYDRVWLVTRWYSTAGRYYRTKTVLRTDFRVRSRLRFHSQYGADMVVYVYDRVRPPG